MNYGPGVTHQLEDFKEVQVGVEDVLDLLQPLLAQGAHGVANSVEAHAAGEDDEALEQGLAAGDVFELQVRDAIGELAMQKNKREKKKRLYGMLILLWNIPQRIKLLHEMSPGSLTPHTPPTNTPTPPHPLPQLTCSSRSFALTS